MQNLFLFDVDKSASNPKETKKFVKKRKLG